MLFVSRDNISKNFLSKFLQIYNYNTAVFHMHTMHFIKITLSTAN